jgi:N12 class adenine-specific DNA methylase
MAAERLPLSQGIKMAGLFDDVLGDGNRQSSPGLFDDVLRSKIQRPDVGQSDSKPPTRDPLPPAADGYNGPGMSAAPVGRTFGEFISDQRHAAGEGVASAVGGLIEAPVGLVNAAVAYSPLRMAIEKLSPSTGVGIQKALHIEQPDVVKKAAGVFHDIAADQRSKMSVGHQMQAEQLNDTEGAWDTAKFLATNPAYTATEATKVLAQMVPGGVVAKGATTAGALARGAQSALAGERAATAFNVGLQAAMAGSLQGNEVRATLEAMPMEKLKAQPEFGRLKAALETDSDEDVRDWLIKNAESNAFAESFAINAVTPFLIPHGATIEKAMLGQGAAGASRWRNALLGGAGEAAEEGIAESGEQISQNVRTFRPWDEGVGKAGALGAVLGAGMGVPAGALQAPSDGNTNERLDRVLSRDPTDITAAIQAGTIKRLREDVASAPTPETRAYAEQNLADYLVQTGNKARPAIINPATGQTSQKPNGVTDAAATGTPVRPQIPFPGAKPSTASDAVNALATTQPGSGDLSAVVQTLAPANAAPKRRQIAADEVTRRAQAKLAELDAWAAGEGGLTDAEAELQTVLRRNMGNPAMLANMLGADLAEPSAQDQAQVPEPQPEEAPPRAVPPAQNGIVAPLTPSWVNQETGAVAIPGREDMRAALESQMQAQFAAHGNTALDSDAIAYAWQASGVDVSPTAITKVARDIRKGFTPATAAPTAESAGAPEVASAQSPEVAAPEPVRPAVPFPDAAPDSIAAAPDGPLPQNADEQRAGMPPIVAPDADLAAPDETQDEPATPSEPATPEAVEPDAQVAPPGIKTAIHLKHYQRDVSPSDLVKTKDVNGKTVFVHKDALADESATQLPMYTSRGTQYRAKDRHQTIHRENLDLDGSKRAAGPGLPYYAITTRTGEKPFKTARAAKKAVTDDGQNLDDYEITAHGAGFVAIRKSDADQKAAQPAQSSAEPAAPVVGDRVNITGGAHKGKSGSVTSLGKNYGITFDDGSTGRVGPKAVQKAVSTPRETVDPANDPIVGEDIHGSPIRKSKAGTYYTVEHGRVRTGPPFKEGTHADILDDEAGQEVATSSEGGGKANPATPTYRIEDNSAAKRGEFAVVGEDGRAVALFERSRDGTPKNIRYIDKSARAAVDGVLGIATQGTPTKNTNLSFNEQYDERVKESKDAGNVHLDQLDASVEGMRGRRIHSVHDPKVRGVVRTVDNSGNVWIYWSDDYSAKKEMATPSQEGKKTVFRSILGPRDLKDYVVEGVGDAATHADIVDDDAATADRFANNKMFTSDKVAAAKARLKAKLGQLNSGVDPELFVDGVTIAGAYIESGVRKFADYAKAMVDDLGDAIKPYLLSFYEGVRYYPGVDAKGMDSAADAQREFDALLTPADLQADAIGNAKPPRKTRAKATTDRGARTLRDDWGVDHINGYSNTSSREKGNDTKDAFLKDASAYLKAVAEALEDQGYTVTLDRKGKPAKAVSVNESGMAGSGDVYLHMVAPDGTGIYVHVGDTTLRGAVPSTTSGIALMYRTTNGTQGKSGANQWGRADLTAAELAAELASHVQRHPWVDGSNKGTLPVRVPVNVIGRDGLTDAVPAAGKAPLSVAPTTENAHNPAQEAVDAPDQANRQSGQPPLVSGGRAREDGSDAAAGAANRGSVDAGVAEAGEGAAGAGDLFAGASGAGRDGSQGAVRISRDDASGEARDRGTVRAEPGTADAVEDFDLTGEALGKGGLATKYRENVAAIRIVKTLEAEGRVATPEERKQLARYVGWGALKGVFDQNNKQWAKQHAELKELLTSDEYAAARASTRNAHFTSQEVVAPMIDGLQRLGFTKGRLLEPSVGTGNFFGMMPARLRQSAELFGVELDPITSKIAAGLYPSARITNSGFEDYQVPGGFFDAAIGNPPFGEEPIADSDRSPYSGFSIHNYFIAKTIDKLRPGGVAMMVVSHNFLDARDNRARKWIAERASLVAAVRLPDTAFKGNAGTEVVTDVLVFQKHQNGIPNGERAWVDSGRQKLENPKTGESSEHNVSQYFLAHPENVLGEPTAGGSMYRANDYTVKASGDLATQLTEWVNRLPEGIYQPIDRTESMQKAEVPDGIKVGSYYVDGKGVIQQRGEDTAGAKTADAWTPPNAKAEARMRGMIAVRDALRAQMLLERDPLATDKAIAASRNRLNKAYDTFLKEHGYLNSPTNYRLFKEDSDSDLVQALEFDYDNGISKAVADREGIEPRAASARKADIFERRVAFPQNDMQAVFSAKDALIASLNYRGTVDPAYMARVYGKDQDAIVAELGDLVYSTPEGGIETADAYLSGDVKTKLAEAEAAAKADSAFTRNVKALKAVIPKDKSPSEIHISLGAHFVPSSIVEDFIEHITGAKVSTSYVKSLGRWMFNKTGHIDEVRNAQTWGTPHIGADKIIQQTIDGRTVVVTKTEKVGDSTRTIVLEAETEAAREKQNAIRNEWKSWLWRDPERGEKVLAEYNDKMNRTVRRSYDGSHLSLPGKNPAITLLKHQLDGIWRGLQSRQILLDHVVGAGKTFQIVGMIMEMRRLGIARKPVLAVPNHLTLQWRSEFTRLYPGARVLAARPEDFSKENRPKLFSKIVTGDWDAVILGHSSLKKIGLPSEVEANILKEQIDDLAKAIEEIKRERGDRNIVRDMEGIKRNLEAKMKERLSAAGPRDKVLTFDELGLDALGVDELHEFKNLTYSSTMTKVPGMGNPKGSARAFDLFMKTQWLFKTYGDQAPLITATGTPVSNSLVEMYNVQRYMQYPQMKRDGLHMFDAWARAYGSVENVYEVAPSGSGFRASSRFAKFQNLSSLMADYLSFADVITLDDLKVQEEARGGRFPVPKVKGGRPQLVVAPRSPLVADFMGVPKLSRWPDGGAKFKLDLAHGDTFETEDMDGKVFLRMHKAGDDTQAIALGTYENAEEARAGAVEAALTPEIDLDEKSVLGRFARVRELTRETKGKVNALSLTGEANKAGLDYRLINPNAPDFPDSKINRAVDNIVAEYKAWKKDKGTQLVFCDMSVPISARAALANKPKRAYVRDTDGSVIHRRATLHSLEGAEELPFLIVEARAKTKDRPAAFAVYDAATGHLMADDQPSRAAAKEWAESALAGADARARWVKDREASGELQQEEIDEYNDANEIDTAEVEAVTLQDIAGVSASAGFSVYDDMRAKLIKNGIPEREIAFIHDYSTPSAKAKLFAAVNRGDVRVLFGSTPKMGAGTNVQERAVALHHIDAPWKPSDLEQREGRVIRRGNKLYDRDPEGFEVGIYRYATAQTYDARRWQILEHKARGIEQLRTFDGTINEIDDIDGEASNAADMKAAASGDPLILRETQLRNDVKRLENLEAAHADNVVAARRAAQRSKEDAEKYLPRKLKTIETMLAERLPDTKEGVPTGSAVGGKKISDRKEFTQAIARAVGEIARDVVLGRNPDDLTIKWRGLSFEVTAGVFGSVHVGNDLGDILSFVAKEADSFSASGLITRMNNAVDRLDAQKTSLTEQIEEARTKAERFIEEAAKPFADAENLASARRDFKSVQRLLLMKGPDLQAADKKTLDAGLETQREALRKAGLGDALDEMLAARRGSEGMFSRTDPETGNVVLFSRHNESTDPIENPLSVQEVEDAIAGIRLSSRAGLARNGVKVVVVPDYSGFPPNEDGSPHTFTAGYIPGTSTIAIVAMRVRNARSARKALIHEMVGHFGLNLFPPKVKQDILDRINRTRDGKALSGVWKEIKALYADKSEIEQAEEVFARIAEDTPSNMRLWWDRFIANFLTPALRKLGLVGPITKSELRVLAAEIARGIREGAVQRTAADGSMLEQRVWHGTPHRGIEQTGFKLNKIGTGAGAQAYGYGMNFASRREIAEWYAENVRTDATFGALILSTPVEQKIRGWMQEADRNGDRMAAGVYDELLAGDLTPAVLRRQYADSLRDGEIEQSEHDQAVAAIERAEQLLEGRGQLYHAEIPEDSDLLDWDKPLSEQPEKVRKAIKERAPFEALDFMSGWDIYDAASAYSASEKAGRYVVDGKDPQAGSALLNSIGIPGLRYLDGNSRRDGKGSHNYVIWDEALLTPEKAQITPYYSRAENNKSSFLTSAADVQAAVRNVLDTWKGDKPVVRLVRSVAEARKQGANLPADAPSDVEGWWDGGSTVWIVAGNNRDVARALETLSHEAIGHYGIERVMGKEAWARLVADVKRLRGLKQSDVSPKIWKALQSAERRYGNESAETFAKEFLAIMAEQGIRSGLTMRVVAKIRQFLAKLGIPMNISKAFREAELLDALYRGRKRVTQAPRGQAASTGRPAREMAFSQSTPTFYSAMLDAVSKAQGVPKKGGDAAFWKGWMDGAIRRGEMKQAERDWLGVDDWLAKQDGAVARDHLTDFIRANQVQVQDVVLGDNDAVEAEVEAWWNDESGANEETPYSELTDAERRDARERYRDEVAQYAEGGPDTKFGQYQLPGGENYRELLLTLPVQELKAGDKLGGGTVNWKNADGSYNVTMPDGSKRVIGNDTRQGVYRSNHFDQPNILAHVRFNERTDADGKKVLFLEEIQSDWHQAGRKQGYARADRPDAEVLKLLEDAGYTASHNGTNWVVTSKDGSPVTNKLAGGSAPNQFAANLAQVAQMVLGRRDLRAALGAVPDAPFKATDEWAMLAFKRMVRMAAENGFDRIAWATGEQQAERYDLSKQVDAIRLDGDFDQSIEVSVARDGEGFEHIRSTTKEGLAEIVGKEIADKAINGGQREFRGVDLKVGGSGMRGFYDKILPSAVNKWAKPFGARAGSTRLVGSSTTAELESAAAASGYSRAELDAMPASDRIKAVEAKLKPVHAIDLTPKMRDAALAGQPMFSRKDDATKMPSGVGNLSQDQLDVLRQLGLLSQEQEADLSGREQGNRDERPINEWGERITTEQDKAAYLRLWGRPYGELPDGASPESSAAVGAESRPLERVVRRLSESATRELGGVHDAARDFSVRLGPFSGYQTRARVKNQGMPQEALVVEVFGKEQVEAGVNEEPALTWTIHVGTGEMDVNGPNPDRATFRAFHKRGWADHARGQDGEVAAGWTALRNPDGSASLPMGQILPMLADVHARYRALRKEDRVGLHWSRITGATGGMAGREAAVFFSRPDPTPSNPTGSPLVGNEPAIVSNFEKLLRPGKAVVQAAKNLLEQFRPVWLGAFTLDQLVELAGKRLPQIKHYADILQELDVDRNVMQEEAGTFADEWQKWAAKHREDSIALNDLMHEATIAGTDPAKDFAPLPIMFGGQKLEANKENVKQVLLAIREQMRGRAGDSKREMLARAKEVRGLIKRNARREKDHKTLQEQWQALSPEAQAMYRRARDMYAKRRDQREAALKQRIRDMDMDDRRKQSTIAKIQAMFEAQRVQAPYFPLQRQGDFWISAESPEGEPTYIMREKVGEWQKEIDALKAAGFKIKATGRKGEKARLLEGASAKFITEVIQHLQKTGAPIQAQDDIYQMYLQSLPEMSQRKHSIHRKAVSGYGQDAIRNFASNMLHEAHQIARLKYSHQLEGFVNRAEKHNNAVRKHGDADPKQIAAADAMLSELKKRHEWIMNPSNSRAASTATSLGFVYYLGLTPATALVNLTQVVQTTLPHLSAHPDIGLAKASTLLTSAMKDALRTGGNIGKTLTKPEERRAYRMLVDRGALDKSLAHNLAGLSGGDSTKYNPAYAKAMEIIAFMFHKAEVVNREATGMAAFRAMRLAGKSFDEAVQFATDAIWKTHFNYGNSNRPRWMQSDTAKVLFLFKQYSQNMTWFLGRNAYQALKGETKAVRRQALKTLSGTLGMTGIMAGAMGMPLLPIVFTVLNAVAASFGDDDDYFDAETELRNFLADVLGQRGGRIVTEGVVNELTGANIAGRVGLSDMWVREPNRELEGRDSFAYYLEQLAGPVFGMGKNLFVGKQLMDEGHLMRGWETILPKAFRDGLKAFRFGTEGVNTLRGDPVIEGVSPWQLATQASGFSLAEASAQYEANNAAMKFETHVIGRRQALMDAYAMALRMNDLQAHAKVLDGIRRFNAKYPELGIKASTLRNSLRARQRYSDRSQGGVVLNPNLADRSREQARFGAGSP